MKRAEEPEQWDTVIHASKTNSLGLANLSRFKDLLFLLVRRDLVTLYKQTALGPFWLILQPLLTALTFTIIFGKVASLPTDGTPPFLFYYSGILIWSFFSECILKVSDTFTTNADLFGKVFFPRIIVPFSVVMTTAIKAGINFCIFLIIWAYFVIRGYEVQMDFIKLLLLPLIFLIPAMLGLGLGLMIASFTAKYKDLRYFLQFGIQLLLYLSPIIYPLSILQGKFKMIIACNPMSAPVEYLRNIFLGKGSFDSGLMVYSFVCCLCILLLGLFVFNRSQQSFIDTV